MKQIIGVYGTWRATEDSAIYQSAMEIGRAAARRGFAVLTGAYTGIMEAAPRGAKEAGGAALGYSWNKLDNELAPNIFLDSIVAFSSAEQRMARLVGDADVCVFFPGRTGTVAELALATEMRAKGEKLLPLVLVGEFWCGFFSWLEQSNNALGLPADASGSSGLYIMINSASDFDHFLDEHENLWNK
jgi:uncharacterized protein (TIGR00725 family)